MGLGGRSELDICQRVLGKCASPDGEKGQGGV